MGQWEDKLGAILNNPQAMSQIMSIAQSLGGQGPAAPESESTSDTAPVSEPPMEPVQAPADVPGLDLDPRLMEAGMRALSAWNDPDDSRARLLQALGPFLKEERRGKLDKAVRIVRLSRAVRTALDGLQGGVRADV